MKHLTMGLASVLVMVGCGSDKPAEKATLDGGAASEAPAFGGGLGGLGMLSSMLSSQVDQPGPYDEKGKSDGFDDSKPHMAILEIAEPVVELRTMSLLGQSGGVELRELTDTIAKLAANDQVRHLVLRFGDAAMSFAAAEELRAEIVAFGGDDSDRAVHCYADSPANVTYMVMSACDSIGIAPVGQVTISGVAAMPIHLRGALDRLGVEADFLHIGAFKGAAEPLTRDAPSPEMVTTLEAILDQTYAVMVEAIASGRKLEPGQVKKLVDTAVFVAEDAVTAKLVDEVATFESWRDGHAGDLGWRVVELAGSEPPSMATLMQSLGLVPRKRPSAPHVALVYAVGNVVDGKGSGPIGARSEIAPRPLVAALRALAADDAVKAVVLRVDSGGGSALASETIWQAIADVRKQKPVVMSMGSVAASGGYYIGCGADAIYASQTTLTGSIGVVGGKLAVNKGLRKLGISTHPMGRGKRALLFASLGPWSPDERAAIRDMMQKVYDAFVARVSEGRGKSVGDVHKVAQGRVWTGAAARERGLVDEIGGLSQALADARKRAGLSDDSPLEIYPPQPTILDWLGAAGATSVSMGVTHSELAAIAADIARVFGPRQARAVTGVLRMLGSLSESPVQTALYWPIVLQ